MMLRSFAAAAILLATTMSGLCFAGDQRFLVLQGSWVKWGAPQWGAGATVTYGFASQAIRFPDGAQLRVAHAVRGTGEAERIAGQKPAR